MEVVISAAAFDLISRFVSFVAEIFCDHYHTQSEDDDYRRLEQVLLRVHTIVEEAEGRHIANRGMLLQLNMLISDMYAGHYVLDRLKIQSVEEDKAEGDVSHQNRSFAMYTPNSTKRLRVASPTRNNTLVASGARSSAAKLKCILQSLETRIQDMREFVVLLVGCPRLPRQPYSTYLFMDQCMFGRYNEKEQVISFLVCNDTHDCQNLEILPILGPQRVGKKTLAHHACKDERVRDCFSDIFFFKGDDLGNGNFAANLNVNSGKYLFVVEFSWGVDKVAWTNFKSYLQDVVGAGSKIVLIGRTHEVAKFGTAYPIWLKCLPQEEYWYYFKALAFGSMDPDEHPGLTSLGMQLATELKGSFLGANIIGHMLRSNPNPQFWHTILSSIRALVQEHLFSYGVHPEDLLERNAPVDFPSVAFVGAQCQRCMVYDLREAGPGQAELPVTTWQEILKGGSVPEEQKFDVLLWKSRIPPYCNYIATFEKQRTPQRMVGKKNRLAPRRGTSA